MADGFSDSEMEFMRLAVEEARKSRPDPGKHSPFVGAVVVKDGVVLASAHRGELKAGEHAEFTALEKKLAGESLAGTTVYATLEPCTKRGEGKVPCAARLVERRVKKVVFGMLDPNPDIRGFGERALRAGNIEVARFSLEFTEQIEEMNRDFTREQEKRNQQAAAQISSPANPAANELDRRIARRALQCFPTEILERFFGDVQTPVIRISDVDTLQDGYDIFNTQLMRFAGNDARTKFELFFAAIGTVMFDCPTFFHANPLNPLRYTMRDSEAAQFYDLHQALIKKATEAHLAWADFLNFVRQTWPDLILELLPE